MGPVLSAERPDGRCALAPPDARRPAPQRPAVRAVREPRLAPHAADQVVQSGLGVLHEPARVERRVAPVLDDHVDLAGAEALPGDVLLEVLVVDRAAELLLRDRADHVGAGFVADPRVDRHVELAAVAAGVIPVFASNTGAASYRFVSGYEIACAAVVLDTSMARPARCAPSAMSARAPPLD